MATASQWLSAARPRTLPAAVAPVLVGAGAALPLLRDSAVSGWFAVSGAPGDVGPGGSPAGDASFGWEVVPASIADSWGGAHWLAAILALVVALALQIGVNYANDYSDGIRGTDGAHRIGPFRLVGSGAAEPRHVKYAAFACFAVAAVAGLILALMTAWWLILVGLVCIVAAWYYTGGEKPYGYAGFGEVFVFVFFGLVAVTGTTFVIAQRIDVVTLILAVATGLLACAILVANNLRDIDTDEQTGKRTLAVLLGDRRTRIAYVAMVIGALVAVAIVGVWYPWCLLALAAWLFAIRPVRVVLSGAKGTPLLPVLVATGLAETALGALVLTGFLLS